MKRLAEEENAASALLAALDAQAAKIAQREPAWQQLDVLLGHVGGLPQAAALKHARHAIHDNRLRLDETDKVEPLLNRAGTLREVQISMPEAPKLGTLTALTGALAACPPQHWIEKRDALRGQLARALNLAAKKLEPNVQPVTPPRRILRTEADLDASLDQIRTAVLMKLPNGLVQL